MNGVEILSSETIYETSYDLSPLFFFASIGLLIGLIIFLANRMHEWGEPTDILVILVCFVIGTIIGAAITSCCNTKEVDYIEYKVTINKDVDLNEFLSKYEILDQEGKIYTVKEKE